VIKGTTLAAAAALLLAACASPGIDPQVEAAGRLSRERLGAELQWLRTDDARREAAAQVDALLKQPLSADDAMRIALAHSPALQALIFEAEADAAAAAQAARLPNPVFAFEHLVRSEGGARELEITRSLGLSLADLLLLPARLRGAQAQQQRIGLQLEADVVRVATQARQAWVRAVAAQQALQYHEQVKAAADASSELARRMQAAGNFSRLQRAREQVFAAEALAELARAQQQVLATREALVRALGLGREQAARLRLPDRLPDLPNEPRAEASTAQAALDQRLDLRMARAELDRLAREQGLGRASSVVNGLQLGAVRKSDTGLAGQRGYELELPLPVFDFGDARRGEAQARYMAAFNRTAQLGAEAASQVREAHAAYLHAYGLARHYRDEVLPLRKTIQEENLLRYNGMLIGVFELLAEARSQIAAVAEAIDAQRDFWLADAALQATLIGAPSP